MNKFIERNDLTEVENIDRVILDCIDDRVALEETEVMTFEQFQITDDNRMYNVEFDIDMEVQKIIADAYQTSLGYIESIGNNGETLKEDTPKNHLMVRGVGIKKELYVFTPKNIENVIIQVCDNLYNIISTEDVEYPLLNIRLNMAKKVDKAKFLNRTYVELIRNHGDIIVNILTAVTGDQYAFKGQKNEVYIFEKMS